MDLASKGNLETVVNCLQREKSITLIGHSIPDGDCVGACLGLGLALESAGKCIRVVLVDAIPSSYDYLEGKHLLTKPEDIPSDSVMLYLDCADPERTGALPDFLDKARMIINIDHHVSNPGFGNYCWVQPNASATCEICLQVLDAMGIKPSVAVANALYTGILMDTGNFLYNSVTPQTLRVAARLLEYGAEKNKIREALFESKSLREMQVLKLTLQNLRFNQARTVGWSVLPRSELVQIGAQDLHFEGMINHIRNIEGIEVAVLFREMEDNRIKVGFRSRDQVDVNKVAASFGGGGHRLASGASLDGALEQVISMVTERVEKYLS